MLNGRIPGPSGMNQRPSIEKKRPSGRTPDHSGRSLIRSRESPRPSGESFIDSGRSLSHSTRSPRPSTRSPSHSGRFPRPSKGSRNPSGPAPAPAGSRIAPKKTAALKGGRGRYIGGIPSLGVRWARARGRGMALGGKIEKPNPPTQASTGSRSERRVLDQRVPNSRRRPSRPCCLPETFSSA